MRSSMVSMIQKCFCGWVSFGVTPNLVQEISHCLDQTALARLFHPLIVSIKEIKTFITAAETLPNIKTFQIVQKNRKQQN